MADILKGKISCMEEGGTKARVLPSTADQIVTRPLVIPGYMLTTTANLDVGVEVCYALFEDKTGIILARVDGKWHPTFTEDVTANDISLEHHTHPGVHGQTGGSQ